MSDTIGKRPVVVVVQRQRLERAFLQRLEPLAARDAKARVAPGIDALDALGECLVDLRQ